jgi:hypothetical protein
MDCLNKLEIVVQVRNEEVEVCSVSILSAGDVIGLFYQEEE